MNRILVAITLLTSTACGGKKQPSIDQATLDRVADWTARTCACKNLPDGSAPNNPEQLKCAVDLKKAFADFTWPNEFEVDAASAKKFKDARRNGLMCEDAIYGTTRNGY